MAYMAMARKWRPKNFEEMVGQDHIAQTIRNAINGNRISHAYLFTGTRGVGKTTSARILAKALNCGNGPTPTPCDTCDNCKAVNAGNSMDVLEIDGASNNSVDNIRDLREQIKYAPMHGTYKIYVIDEVHMLSKSAFNALLKTLEEPPPHVIFIFATTEANKLPHTILSRVQRFDFKRISEANIRERLEYICSQESIQPEREALEAISRKADGSMRDALSLFDQVYAFSGAALTMESARKVLGLPREGLFDGLLSALISHDQKACFTAIQEAHREGIETTDFLVAFGEYNRNLLFSRQGVSAVALGLSENRYHELAAMAPELRDGDIIRFAKMISDLLAQLKTAANPRLTVELGFARMASLDRVISLSQVLAQDFPIPTQAQTTTPTTSDSEVKKKNPTENIDVTPTTKTEAPRPVVSRPPIVPATVLSTAPATAPAFQPELNHPVSFSEIETAAFTAPEVQEQTTSATAAGYGSESSEDYSESITSTPESTPGFDPDLDKEMEETYDRDADEAKGALSTTRLVVATDKERAQLAVQESSNLLPDHWPQLVAEFIAARPVLGSHLLRTRLDWESGELPGLRLVFLEKSAYYLVGEDADFKKSIQHFLVSKLRTGLEFTIRYSLDEAAAESRDTAALPFGSDDPLQIPIVGFIINLFEGRQVD